jgi:predicted nucleic-acid-binding protein
LIDRLSNPVLLFSKGGGDFADGVIAFEGRRAGARVFTSFDKEAVDLVEVTGGEALLSNY